MQRSDSTHHGVSGKIDCTGLAGFAREIGLLQVGNWSENLGGGFWVSQNLGKGRLGGCL